MSKYETKLKLMSLFYIILAIIILLNACIGFSSSPYYERYTSCEKYNLTSECKSLRHRVNVIYSCELIGSVALVVHGLIGMILYDNMRVIWIARLLSCYSRLSILGYAFIIIVRTSYYIDIVPMLQPESSDQNIDSGLSWFTGMLTVNVQNQTLALVLSIIFVTVISTCFLCDCCLIALSNNLVKTIKEYEARTSKDSNKLFVKSTINDEE